MWSEEIMILLGKQSATPITSTRSPTCSLICDPVSLSLMLIGTVQSLLMSHWPKCMCGVSEH